MIAVEGIDEHIVAACPSEGDRQPCILITIADADGSSRRCYLSTRNARLLAQSITGDCEALAPLEKLWENQMLAGDE